MLLNPSKQSPMMYDIGYDEATCYEAYQHNECANHETDVGITHLEGGHIWFAFIGQTDTMIYCT